MTLIWFADPDDDEEPRVAVEVETGAISDDVGRHVTGEGSYDEHGVVVDTLSIHVDGREFARVPDAVAALKKALEDGHNVDDSHSGHTHVRPRTR